MPQEKITNVSVPVTDQQAAKAFYMDKLGFEIVVEVEMPDMDDKWIQLKPPAGETAISLVTWIDSLSPGKLDGVVLETDDIDTSRAQLADRGVEITDVTDADWGRWATFRDLDGNGWVLVQLPEGRG